MKEKPIGIIIQNQDDKILLYDDTYYIKEINCLLKRMLQKQPCTITGIP